MCVKDENEKISTQKTTTTTEKRTRLKSQLETLKLLNIILLAILRIINTRQRKREKTARCQIEKKTRNRNVFILKLLLKELKKNNFLLVFIIYFILI